MTKEFNAEISKIIIPDNRARALDPAMAEALAGIFRKQPLQHRIRVRVLPEGLRLVAGLHRLHAFIINGETHIPAEETAAVDEDEERLEEVMENLGRNDLNALDRCHHLYELKQVYERLYPETKAGVAGGLARHGSASEIFSFAADTAEKIGLSRRSIEIAVKIWSELTGDSRRRLPGMSISRKQSELKLLSAQTVAMQKKIVDLLQLDGNEGMNVQGALDFFAAGTSISPMEKRYQTIANGFASLKEDDFDRLLEAHEDRVIASLKRRGRI